MTLTAQRLKLGVNVMVTTSSPYDIHPARAHMCPTYLITCTCDRVQHVPSTQAHILPARPHMSPAWQDHHVNVVQGLELPSLVRDIFWTLQSNDQLFCLCSALHRCLGFFGQLFLLERTPEQCQPHRTGWWVYSQPFEFLTKAERVSGPWFVPTSSLPFSALTCFAHGVGS